MHTMVSKLRRNLGDDASDPTYLFTEPRVGFRMRVEVASSVYAAHQDGP